MDTAIILFVYNRPEHTQKVLNGLKNNKIDKLFVFCDGIRKPEEEPLVQQTIKMINDIDWCEVDFTISEKNKGLATSVIKGVSDIFSKGFDSVIVLEDDCIPDQHFINYMKSTLAYYKDTSEVMHVSGFGLPLKKYTSSDIYFTPYPCSWGWGTWAETWGKCDFNQQENYKELLGDKNKVREFNYSGEAFSEFLEMQLQGKVNSWLIRWYFYIFQNNGKCVWSYESHIRNAGFDGSGVHKNKIDRFNQKVSVREYDKFTLKFEEKISYNPKLIREFRRHFMGKKFLEKAKTSIYLLTGVIVGR